jgi:hypothetical protein
MPTAATRRASFSHWVLHDRGGTVMVPPAPATDELGPGVTLLREVWSIQELLHCLWDDLTPLPDAVRASMGLPPGATHAHAARLLTILRVDDTFPATSHGDVVTRLGMLPPAEVDCYWQAVDEAISASTAPH